MSYYLADANGYIDDFASIGGLRDFAVWAAGVGGPVSRFVREGHTDNPAQLATFLEGTIAGGSNEDLRQALLAAAKSAERTLIVSDGSSLETELEALYSEAQERDGNGRWTVHAEGVGGEQVSNHNTYMGAVLAANRMADKMQKTHHVHTPSGKRIYTAPPNRSLFGDVHPNVGEADKEPKPARMREFEPKLFSEAVRALKDFAIGFAFDKTNPAAKKRAADHAGDLIEGISKTTRQNVKDLVEAAFEEQFDVDELADMIANELGDTDGVRSERIARTETMRASNEGQQEAWSQAVSDGLLTGDEQQVWITTPDERVCPICNDMDGETAPLDGTFNVDGEDLDGPPAHPNCRCTVGLA